uniref:ANK_REP_REGION domain-containing protein n=2 Tax=Macrostomum lignano TaxID=282301 RepID=A0A1I8I572_9PLAT
PAPLESGTELRHTGSRHQLVRRQPLWVMDAKGEPQQRSVGSVQGSGPRVGHWHCLQSVQEDWLYGSAEQAHLQVVGQDWCCIGAHVQHFRLACVDLQSDSGALLIESRERSLGGSRTAAQQGDVVGASAQHVVDDKDEEQWSQRVTLEDSRAGAEVLSWAIAGLDKGFAVVVEVHHCNDKSRRDAIVSLVSFTGLDDCSKGCNLLCCRATGPEATLEAQDHLVEARQQPITQYSIEQLSQSAFQSDAALVVQTGGCALLGDGDDLRGAPAVSSSSTWVASKRTVLVEHSCDVLCQLWQLEHPGWNAIYSGGSVGAHGSEHSVHLVGSQRAGVKSRGLGRATASWTKASVLRACVSRRWARAVSACSLSWPKTAVVLCTSRLAMEISSSESQAAFGWCGVRFGRVEAAFSTALVKASADSFRAGVAFCSFSMNALRVSGFLRSAQRGCGGPALNFFQRQSMSQASREWSDLTQLGRILTTLRSRDLIAVGTKSSPAWWSVHLGRRSKMMKVSSRPGAQHPSGAGRRQNRRLAEPLLCKFFGAQLRVEIESNWLIHGAVSVLSGPAGAAEADMNKGFFSSLPFGRKKKQQKQQPQPLAQTTAPQRHQGGANLRRRRPAPPVLEARREADRQQRPRRSGDSPGRVEYGQTYAHEGNVEGVYYNYMAADDYGSPYVQSEEAFKSSTLSLEYTEKDVVMPDRDRRFSQKAGSRTRSMSRDRYSSRNISRKYSTGSSRGSSRRNSEIDVEVIRAARGPAETEAAPGLASAAQPGQVSTELTELVRDISEQFNLDRVDNEDDWEGATAAPVEVGGSGGGDRDSEAIQEFFAKSSLGDSLEGDAPAKEEEEDKEELRQLAAVPTETAVFDEEVQNACGVALSVTECEDLPRPEIMVSVHGSYGELREVIPEECYVQDSDPAAAEVAAAMASGNSLGYDFSYPSATTPTSGFEEQHPIESAAYSDDHYEGYSTDYQQQYADYQTEGQQQEYAGYEGYEGYPTEGLAAVRLREGYPAEGQEGYPAEGQEGYPAEGQEGYRLKVRKATRLKVRKATPTDQYRRRAATKGYEGYSTATGYWGYQGMATATSSISISTARPAGGYYGEYGYSDSRATGRSSGQAATTWLRRRGAAEATSAWGRGAACQAAATDGLEKFIEKEAELPSQNVQFPFKSHFSKFPKLPNPKKAIKQVLKGESKRVRREKREQEEMDRIMNTVNPFDHFEKTESDEWKEFEQFRRYAGHNAEDELRLRAAEAAGRGGRGARFKLPPLPSEVKKAEEEKRKPGGHQHDDRGDDLAEVATAATAASEAEYKGPESIVDDFLREDKQSADEQPKADESEAAPQQASTDAFGAAFGAAAAAPADDGDGGAGLFDNDEFTVTEEMKEAAAREALMEESLAGGSTVARERPRPKAVAAVAQQDTLSGNNPFRKDDSRGSNEDGAERNEAEGEAPEEDAAAPAEAAEAKPKSFNPLGTIYPQDDSDSSDEEEEDRLKVRIRTKTTVLEKPLESAPVPVLSAPPKIELQGRFNPFDIDESQAKSPQLKGREVGTGETAGDEGNVWGDAGDGAQAADGEGFGDDLAFEVNWERPNAPTPMAVTDVAMEARKRLRSPTPPMAPFEPFHPRYEEDGWRVMVRMPEKKKKMSKQISKFTSDRWWKEIHVRIAWEQDRPTLRLFNQEDPSTPYRTVRLEPHHQLSRDKLQQYDKYGKLHIFKVNMLTYKEIVGVRTEKWSLKTIQTMISKPKTADVFDHMPVRTEIVKFGSMDQYTIRSLMWAIEDEMMKISVGRDRNKAPTDYSKEECCGYVQDEFEALVDKEGHTLHQKSRTRVFFMAFVAGMPFVELGLNDKWRYGNEVVKRQDIIPIMHDDWIEMYEPEFHAVVDMQRYEQSHMICFYPLDACRFELMRFRVPLKANQELPVQLKCVFNINKDRVDIRCDVVVPGFFSSHTRCHEVPAEDIEIRIPLPEDWVYFFRQEGKFKYNSVHSTLRRPGRIKGIERITQMAQGFFPPSIMEADTGVAKYEHLYRAIVWRIGRLPEKHHGAYKSHLFTCKLQLGPHDTVPAWETLNDSLHVEFTMPGSTVSGCTIRSIGVEHTETPGKFVKYIAKYSYNWGIQYVLGERKDAALKSILDDVPPMKDSDDEAEAEAGGQDRAEAAAASHDEEDDAAAAAAAETGEAAPPAGASLLSAFVDLSGGPSRPLSFNLNDLLGLDIGLGSGGSGAEAKKSQAPAEAPAKVQSPQIEQQPQPPQEEQDEPGQAATDEAAGLVSEAVPDEPEAVPVDAEQSAVAEEDDNATGEAAKQAPEEVARDSDESPPTSGPDEPDEDSDEGDLC